MFKTKDKNKKDDDYGAAEGGTREVPAETTQLTRKSLDVELLGSKDSKTRQLLFDKTVRQKVRCGARLSHQGDARDHVPFGSSVPPLTHGDIVLRAMTLAHGLTQLPSLNPLSPRPERRKKNLRSLSASLEKRLRLRFCHASRPRPRVLPGPP